MLKKLGLKVKKTAFKESNPGNFGMLLGLFLLLVGCVNRFSLCLVHYYITICWTGFKILKSAFWDLRLKFDEIQGFGILKESSFYKFIAFSNFLMEPRYVPPKEKVLVFL